MRPLTLASIVLSLVTLAGCAARPAVPVTDGGALVRCASAPRSAGVCEAR